MLKMVGAHVLLPRTHVAAESHAKQVDRVASSDHNRVRLPVLLPLSREGRCILIPRAIHKKSGVELRERTQQDSRSPWKQIKPSSRDAQIHMYGLLQGAGSVAISRSAARCEASDDPRMLK